MKHALETQAALVTLARSLALDSVEIHGSDGTIYFDSYDQQALDAAYSALAARYREVMDGGRKAWKVSHNGARLWRTVDSQTLRRAIRLELTEIEKHERRLGAWATHARQVASRGGRGELAKTGGAA